MLFRTISNSQSQTPKEELQRVGCLSKSITEKVGCTKSIWYVGCMVDLAVVSAEVLSPAGLVE